ncbi:MAG TPA: preprotein translocase subunit YajC [Sphingorhabdus sp.]|jgi:preprotein translocase subunit YajC|uniref:preprotein translocase subunit YajC n=1 Tax=Sphingorhabdus sp. TaxID=1902408 RepID=UPI002BCEFC19|nr:preprotein translocase subunit YajC [Sphingorhabdus sp.]HMT42273.1 preprotein translocase subunit YajC [Sphingorhabdus sp.]HMU21189.1 preprotein translocase subunit YajC [Sphingorhabdus sp.]
MIFAAAAAGAAGGSVSGMNFFTTNILPLLLIFVVFYFLLIRPQQKRAKEHQAKIEAVGKNDEVVTGGGLMGKVTKVADDHVEVELAPNVRVKALKSTLADVKSRTTKPAND